MERAETDRFQAARRARLASIAIALVLGFATGRVRADNDADAARGFAKALGFSKVETARAVDEHAWEFDQLVLLPGTRVLSAVTTSLEPPPKGAGTIATPRVKLVLEHGGK